MNTGAQLRADRSIVNLSHEERLELVAEGASESFQPEAIPGEGVYSTFMSTRGAAQFLTC